MSDQGMSTRIDILKIIAGAALYAAVMIWYVATANAAYNAKFEALAVRFESDERRLANTEQQIQQLSVSENQISDRLARVEEKLSDELETSRRIEIMVQGMVRRGK